MARARITLEFDGGTIIDITEVSAFPILDGPQGAALVQAAFEKIIRSVGLQVVSPEDVQKAVADQAAAAASPADGDVDTTKKED